MVELRLNKNRPTVIPRVKMMELLKDALKSLEGSQGLSVAEILKYVTTSQEVQPKAVLPRLLDTIKTAEDMGLIEKLRNDKYALAEGSTYLCGTCGGKKRQRKASRRSCKKKKKVRRKRSVSCKKKKKKKKKKPRRHGRISCKRKKKRARSRSSRRSSRKKHCKKRKKSTKRKKCVKHKTKRKKSSIVRCEDDRTDDIQGTKERPSPPNEVSS
ncbi:uncharacterized protein [Rhodnius prolixus]|uniref:H15 domain-containing protein n=1 Tax=Rhodnius prolixus TaxID=13249 RepID=T1HDH2_RHOPR